MKAQSLLRVMGWILLAATWQSPAAGAPQSARTPAAQTPAPATAPPNPTAQTPTGQKPPFKPMLAEDVYQNIEIFKGKDATRLLPAMLALRGLLGVECSYCHEPHDWANEEKAQKQKARQMFELIKYVNASFFDGGNKVSCWTCHAGEPKPATLPSDPDAATRAAGLIGNSTANADKPAEQVFKNIQTLKGVPAGRFAPIMAMFSRSLGVRCSHCHVPDAFEKDDKPEKLQARKMLAMVGDTIHKFYGPSGPIGCYTCHHGETQPRLDGSQPAATPAPSAPTPKPQ
jgi:hypothetical protein